MYLQLINLLSKGEILKNNRNRNLQRYVMYFYAYQQNDVILPAVILRLDTLLEIIDSMSREVLLFLYLGIMMMPRLSFVRCLRK